MSQLQTYTKVTVYYNGALLTEEASVKVMRNSGLNPVSSVAKGFCGFSKGAAHLEIDVTTNVPDAGFEQDVGADMDQGNTVEITILAAGKTLTSVGFVQSDDLDHATDSASKLNFKFYGEFSTWT
jgi:hypothetical protein